MSRVSGTSIQLLFDAVNRGESKCRVQTDLERERDKWSTAVSGSP